MKYHYVQDLAAQVVDLPADTIVSRTIFSGPQTKTVLFAFAPGQELSEHTSAKTAVLTFLEGEAELTLGQETMPAQTGTWVEMPPHLPHSIKAGSRVLMLLTMIDTP